MGDRQVLLLNASEEVLRIIDWQKAIVLLMTGKALAPYMNADSYKIKGINSTYELPKVMMLSQYAHIPHKENIPTRRNILARDKYTCQYCGKSTKDKTKLTIDHVVPSSRGGDSSWTNLVAACERCNTNKGNKTPREWGTKLSRKPFKPSPIQMHLARIGDNLLEEWKYWFD